MPVLHASDSPCRASAWVWCMHRAHAQGCVGRSAARQGESDTTNADTLRCRLDRSGAGQRSVTAGALRYERPGQTKEHRLSLRFERFRAAYWP
jgi:hypothetical protein